MSDATSPPTRIGPLRVVRTIARGGMATVYEAHDPDTGRSYAAKVLNPAIGSHSRFAREYRALTQLDHPNLVRVFRYGVTPEGAPLIVMEHLPGVPAQVRVKRLGRPGDPVRTREAVRIAASVARALAYLHARGIVHRDIKSSNVLVLGDAEVKLLDFGTARLLGSREHLTEPGEFVGTFHYASPEQLTGQPVGAPADLYALGILLYRMLTGRRPFEAENPHQLTRMHLDLAPADPSTIVPGLSPALAAITLRLLAKDPRSRPSGAGEVIDALEALVPRDGRPPPTTAHDVSLIGRDAQVRAVRDLLDRPSPGGALLFSGGPGTGRGRLVDMALREAQQRGFRTFAVGLSGAPHPWANLAERVQQTYGEIEDPAVPDATRRILATTRPDPADVAFVLAARAAADAIPVVLGVRDLDRAARPDVACLFAAFERLHADGAAVLVAAAWGDGPVPRAWPGARLVPVPPLTQTDIARTAAQALGVAAVPPGLVRRLVVASGGMPALVEELLGALPRDAIDGPLAIPPAVRDAVLLRIDALPPLQRRAAEAVALADGELSLEQVAWAMDVPQDAAAAALGALASMRLLREIGGRWGIPVGVTAELIRERTRPTRRNVLSRRIADTVYGSPASARVAEVLLEAGRLAGAAESAIAWATPIAETGRHADALPLLERLAAIPGIGGPERRIWQLLGDCLAEVRPDSTAADHAVAMARQLAVTDTDRMAAELVAARLARARGDTASEREILEGALRRVGDDAAHGSETAPIHARLSDVCRLGGEFFAAERHARAAGLTLGPEPLARALLEQGELRGAEAAAQAALRRADGDLGAELRAGVVLSEILRLQGRLSEAAAAVEPALPVARSQVPAALYAAVLLACARVDAQLFRIGQARERLRAATDALGAHVPADLDTPLALLGAELLVVAGDHHAAAATLDSAFERASRWQFLPHAARLRGARAALRLRREPSDEWARIELAASRRELVAMGAIAAVAGLASERASDPACDADETFADVLAWMEMQPARVTRIEHLVAALRQAERDGPRDRVAVLRERVRALLAQIRGLLSPMDDATLSIHPWRQAIDDAG